MNKVAVDDGSRMEKLGDLGSSRVLKDQQVKEPVASEVSSQVEYKTKWAAPHENLPAYFQHRAQEIPRLARQSIDAVFQLYGYMTFNENKYGILNNMEYAWFFQRVETPESRGKTLQYYGPISFDSVRSPSMLKAFVGTILLAETALPGFIVPQSLRPILRYICHTRDAAIAQAQSYHSVLEAGSYPVLPLDPRLCYFDRTSRGDAMDALDTEVRNYPTLQHLQGIVIPCVRGYYNVWGLLRLLALEDIDTAIPEDGPINTRTRRNG
ncbi:hypothetical protein F5887DRAFT_1283857 [Amanita rubescens]|nr:hypothetical protein F5887DRAFT_1283857 [Amanita rubescens]